MPRMVLNFILVLVYRVIGRLCFRRVSCRSNRKQAGDKSLIFEVSVVGGMPIIYTHCTKLCTEFGAYLRYRLRVETMPLFANPHRLGLDSLETQLSDLSAALSCQAIPASLPTLPRYSAAVFRQIPRPTARSRLADQMQRIAMYSISKCLISCSVSRMHLLLGT